MPAEVVQNIVEDPPLQATGATLYHDGRVVHIAFAIGTGWGTFSHIMGLLAPGKGNDWPRTPTKKVYGKFSRKQLHWVTSRLLLQGAASMTRPKRPRPWPRSSKLRIAKFARRPWQCRRGALMTAAAMQTAHLNLRSRRKAIVISKLGPSRDRPSRATKVMILHRESGVSSAVVMPPDQ